jgi:DNA-binding response OmpR family regulator
MLTAKDGDLDEAEALDTGADDFLSKPFSFPVLVARIRALLRRCGGQVPPPVTVGNLAIDSSARKVLRGGDEIRVTAREFDLLEFLVRRRGQVLSKAEILDGVWSHDFEGDPNIVEVYVRRLRRKIDEPYGTSTIRTVRGAGYGIDDDG